MAKAFVHMLPAERKLWEEWLIEFGKGWHGYEYDVRVGRGVDPGEEYPENIRRMARMLTQKRIDVVAWRQGVLWIFEVKPHAGLSAYGQLLAYEKLYRKTFGYGGPIQLAVVTEAMTPDERELYEEAGIKIFLVKLPT